jgi:cobalt-zinc-cadmium resistance protein CzcA
VRNSGRSLSPTELDEVLFLAAKEVMQPSLFGVAIIIATYIPILSLQGVEGKMFRPMGLTVILALVASILLSLTWVPSLCRQFLKSEDERPHPVLDRVETAYKGLLGKLLERPLLAIAPAVVLVVISGFVFTRLGSTFIPELDEGAIALSGFYKAGTSLDEVVSRSTKLEQVLLAEFPDEISHVMNRIGRPEVATDPMLIHQTDTLISLKPTQQWKRVKSKEALVTAISDVLKHDPGFDATFTQPVKMRMDEMIQGQGLRSDLGIKVFGPDIQKLAEFARDISKTVEGVAGAADVEVEATEGMPQLQIVLDRGRMGRLGVDVQSAQAIVESALAGHKAISIVDGTRKVDVTVRLTPDSRATEADIRAIRIPTLQGRRVNLGDIADIQRVEGPIQISRENAQRRVVIMANVRGRDLGSFAEDVQRKITSSIKLPMGYYIEYAGTYEQLKSGKLRLMIAVPITFVAVFLLLMLTLGNFKHALLVFTGIPFAVSGGILALAVRQMPFSISAGVGFIALAGIAVLNGLVMVTYITSLRTKSASLRDAVIDGAQARIRPVLMTAFVASLGFVPMAIATGSGAEVQKPIATVVIGGLITATVLTLIVLPVIFRMIH